MGGDDRGGERMEVEKEVNVEKRGGGIDLTRLKF